MTFGFEPFDQVMAFVALLTTILTVWGYFYTHPRKKPK